MLLLHFYVGGFMSSLIRSKHKCCLALLVFVLFTSNAARSNENTMATAKTTERLEKGLTLSYILRKVRENDLSIQRFGVNAQALNAMADSSDYFPDPIFFATAQNIPADTFDLDQEAMTQLRVGVRQSFPQGESLEIKQALLKMDSEIQLIEQRKRWAQLKLETKKAWLEAWYWQKNKQLIEQDRIFLVQVRDFIQSLYQVGAKDQSDLIGAQLRLIKLDERRIEADLKFHKFRRRLDTLANERLNTKYVSQNLNKAANTAFDFTDQQKLNERLMMHPEILILDQGIKKSDKKYALAEQNSEPRWGLELSYGLRSGDNSNGSSRADLLTAGLNVQLPLFTQGKNRKLLDAAKYQLDAIENKRVELIQKMRFKLKNMHQQYLLTVEQRQLYENEILPTLLKQKQSALNSYEADKGDFRTVTELFIKELDTKIKHQRLTVNEQLMMAKINYWIEPDNDFYPLKSGNTVSDTTTGAEQ